MTHRDEKTDPKQRLASVIAQKRAASGETSRSERDRIDSGTYDQMVRRYADWSVGLEYEDTIAQPVNDEPKPTADHQAAPIVEARSPSTSDHQIPAEGPPASQLNGGTADARIAGPNDTNLNVFEASGAYENPWDRSLHQTDRYHSGRFVEHDDGHVETLGSDTRDFVPDHVEGAQSAADRSNELEQGSGRDSELEALLLAYLAD